MDNDHTIKEPYIMLEKLAKRIIILAKQINARSIAILLLGSGAFLLKIGIVCKTIKRTVKEVKDGRVYFIVHPIYEGR